MVTDKTGRPLSGSEVWGKVGNRVKNYWLDLELMGLRWVGYIPIHHLRRFFYRISGMKIGNGSSIHMFANYFDPKNIRIGEDTVIGFKSFIDGRDLVQIGSHVAIASEVMIYNSQHDIDSPDFHAILKPVIIEDYVFIGPRAIILPGVTIKKGAVIAAGAVVTEDIEAGLVVGGVPAKMIRHRQVTNFNYHIGRARWFQ